MAQNTAATDATLTEYLAARDVEDPSVDGPAAITHVVDGRGLWTPDSAEDLDADPDDYRAECSCGESFDSWGAATRHVEETH